VRLPPSLRHAGLSRRFFWNGVVGLYWYRQAGPTGGVTLLSTLNPTALVLFEAYVQVNVRCPLL